MQSVFFASLIAAAIHLRIHGDTLGQQGPEILFPLINTIVLFTSGVTAHYAQVAYRKNRRGRFFWLLVLTIVLGAAFLGGQLWEYSNLDFSLTNGGDAEAARAAGCPVFIVPYGYNEGQELRGLDCDAFIDDVPAALKFVKLLAPQ